MNYPKYLQKFQLNKLKKAIVTEVTCANNSDLVIALSLGLGIFLAFSPVWGFQTVLAVSLAFLFRLNKALTLITVNISSIPPFIPLILIAGYQTGALVLTGSFQKEVPQLMSFKSLGENYYQFVIGSLIFAFLVGALFFIVAYLILKKFR
ncbi:DUF2062 domain-containing protein [Ancylomarina longa]|uniref:DUF2062 domain-containing protein n=1 Tax=Ancylomarina longa TaxID=2487017 RepID=A0A434AU30_9BACT|nr:DUF2062 domain-containing protein [Ancylomarina longa]RUT77925.1 DUF2062 domain-containing protein [Ancylomarina longa]